MTTRLDIDELLGDVSTRVVLCCGAGGVGKTTTAAALALRAAEAGRRVVVLTIDPARRLAAAMGLRSLDNTPRPVPGIDAAAGGSLDAMMLDMKRTFDEAVRAATTAEKADQLLANPFYQAVSSSFSGTQEYMAMEKLGQLRARGAWDLIVVDTPPSRSALDFLDAPRRLSTFLDGRFLRLLLAPAKAGGRAYTRVLGAGVTFGVGLGAGVVGAVLTRVLGPSFLRDVQGFVTSLDAIFGGFRTRAEATYALLQAPGTAFLVVAVPEADALREAAYFLARLDAERMPLAGLVLNQVAREAAPQLDAETAEAAADRLDATPGPSLAAGLLRVRAERARLVRRQARLRAQLLAAHPGVPLAEVPATPRAVADLDGLRRFGASMAAQRAQIASGQ